LHLEKRTKKDICKKKGSAGGMNYVGKAPDGPRKKTVRVAYREKGRLLTQKNRKSEKERSKDSQFNVAAKGAAGKHVFSTIHNLRHRGWERFYRALTKLKRHKEVRCLLTGPLAGKKNDEAGNAQSCRAGLG